MKKILLICILAMIAVFNLNAEPLVSVPVATLTHDGVATQFYGANALANAHAAAVSGDIITLNGGTFTACDITKGITLRGACMLTNTEMSEQGMKSSRIRGNSDFHIKVPKTETHALTIEDCALYAHVYIDSVPEITMRRVYHQYYYPNSSTNSVSTIYMGIRPNVDKFEAIQCSFYQIATYSSASGTGTSTNTSTTFNFTNSAISFSGYLPAHVTMDHCVVGYWRTSSGIEYDGVFSNCVFTYYNSSNPSYSQLPMGCTALNCVAVNSYAFALCTSQNCQSNVSLSTLYNTASSFYEYGCYTSHLTEEAAASYLGTDGTEVGIYGGLFPYTLMPDNPLVTKCDVANKTTEDGKLKVEIEVKSVQ